MVKVEITVSTFFYHQQDSDASLLSHRITRKIINTMKHLSKPELITVLYVSNYIEIIEKVNFCYMVAMYIKTKNYVPYFVLQVTCKFHVAQQQAFVQIINDLLGNANNSITTLIASFSTKLVMITTQSLH